MPLDRKFMSPNMGCCMQRGPNPVAWRTPLQVLTGCGGLHRNAPMGGSANGIPLNSRTPDACGPVPSRMPLASVTRSAAKTPTAVEIAIISAIGLFIKLHYNAGGPGQSPRKSANGLEDHEADQIGGEDSRGRGDCHNQRNWFVHKAPL